MDKKRILILIAAVLMIAIFVLFLIWFMWFRTGEKQMSEDSGDAYTGSVDLQGNEQEQELLSKEEMNKIKKEESGNRIKISQSGNQMGEEVSENQLSETAYEEHVVICSADTEEEAKRIAEQVDGTLVKYEYGIGTIEITETVAQLMERLDHMGGDKPEVYPNYIYSINQ